MKRRADEVNQNGTKIETEAPEEAAGIERDSAAEDVRRLRPLTILEHLTESQQPLTLAQLAASRRKGAA